MALQVINPFDTRKVTVVQGGSPGTTIQGGGAAPLQGATVTVQGAAPNLQPANPTAPTPASAPAPVTAVQRTSAPVQKTDLSSRFGVALLNGNRTVFDKTTGQGVNFDQFKALTGIQNPDWANIILDEGYVPGQPSSQPAAAPAPAPATDPNQELARRAAAAGLTLEEYLAVTSGQNPVTAQEKAKIRSDLGIDELEEQVFTPPSKTTQQLYQEAYDTAGLAQIREEFNKLQTQINDKYAQYEERAATINENPWLSEASRVGRVKREFERFQGEVTNLVNRAQQYADLYNDGVAEIDALISRTQTDFANSQQLNTQKLEYLLSKAEEQADSLAQERYSKAYRYLPDYLDTRIESGSALDLGKLPTSYQEYLLAKQEGFEGTYNDYQTMDANRKRSVTNINAGGLTPTQLFDRELKLANDFEKYAQEYRTAARQTEVINEGFNEAMNALKNGKSLNAQSQAVIVGFNKMIDPTSVVRESEYARTPQGQSLINRLEGRITQLRQGGAGLTAADLQGIRDTAVELMKGYESSMLNYAQRTKNQADSIGADLTRVLTPDVIDLLNKAGGSSGGNAVDPLGIR